MRDDRESPGHFASDHRYKDAPLKYEDCSPSRRYSQGTVIRGHARGPPPQPSPASAGEGVDCLRSHIASTTALLLQKPARGDARQVGDRPVVEVGPGLLGGMAGGGE